MIKNDEAITGVLELASWLRKSQGIRLVSPFKYVKDARDKSTKSRERRFNLCGTLGRETDEAHLQGTGRSFRFPRRKSWGRKVCGSGWSAVWLIIILGLFLQGDPKKSLLFEGTSSFLGDVCSCLGGVLLTGWSVCGLLLLCKGPEGLRQWHLGVWCRTL